MTKNKKYDYHAFERLVHICDIDAFKKSFDILWAQDKDSAIKYTKGDTSNQGLLIYAAKHNAASPIIEYLVNTLKAEEPDIINHHDAKGRTACAFAVDSGCINNLRTLITLGANIRTQDWEDRTPLHYAAEGSNNTDAIIDLLLVNGAQIDSRDKHGATPLHIAAKHSLQAIHTLVRYANNHEITLDLNIQDNNLQTPLHYAAESETNGDNALYLLLLGANKNIADTDGKYATDVANEWDANGADYQAINGYNSTLPHDADVFYLEALGRALAY